MEDPHRTSPPPRATLMSSISPCPTPPPPPVPTTRLCSLVPHIPSLPLPLSPPCPHPPMSPLTLGHPHQLRHVPDTRRHKAVLEGQVPWGDRTWGDTALGGHRDREHEHTGPGHHGDRGHWGALGARGGCRGWHWEGPADRGGGAGGTGGSPLGSGLMSASPWGFELSDCPESAGDMGSGPDAGVPPDTGVPVPPSGWGSPRRLGPSTEGPLVPAGSFEVNVRWDLSCARAAPTAPVLCGTQASGCPPLHTGPRRLGASTPEGTQASGCSLAG